MNIVGHNASGKTTLAQKLVADLGFNRVSGDDFRQFVHEHIPYFAATDVSYPNERFDQLNPLVITYRLELTTILLQAKQNVIFDGSGARKSHRERYLQLVHQKFPSVQRVIIWIDLPEDELVDRLQHRGQQWLRQYEEFKKDTFEIPTSDEAELVLHYDQHNYDEIRQRLRDL